MIQKHNTNKYFHSAIRKLFFREFPPHFAQINKAYQLLNIVLRGEKKRLKSQKTHNLPIPYACVFSVTWKCNLNCIGCYAKHYPTEKQLNIKEIEDVLQQSNELGIYIFIVVGGEPLTVPGIIPLLAKYKNAMFFVFTNGTHINNDNILQLKKANNIIPIISTEGTKAFVDQRRGEGMGTQVSNALLLFKKHKVVFGFSSMITHVNLNDVLNMEWLHSLWSYGAKFGFIIDYIPFPKTLDKTMILTDEDKILKRAKIAELNISSKVTLFNFPEDEYKQRGCKSAGNGFIHINANGNVEPCPFSHYAADNIREKSILEILNSPFFTQIRSAFQDKENDHKGCMLFYNDDIVIKIAEQTNAFQTEKES